MGENRLFYVNFLSLTLTLTLRRQFQNYGHKFGAVIFYATYILSKKLLMSKTIKEIG